MCRKKIITFISSYLTYIKSMTFKLSLITIFMLLITKYIFADNFDKKKSYPPGSIQERCIKAL